MQDPTPTPANTRSHFPARVDRRLRTTEGVEQARAGAAAKSATYRAAQVDPFGLVDGGIDIPF